MTPSANQCGTVWPPVLFLMVCAPVVVDVLFGAVTLTTIQAMLATVPTYGFAALLIRGVARRHGAGWQAVIILGAAFVVVAECLIVQTSLAPTPEQAWGRAIGVNWPYLVWALGYLNVWATILSIQLTELVFPEHRGRPWPTSRGMGVLATGFVVLAIPTWYNWTHLVAPGITRLPVYTPSPGTLVLAVLAAGCLITAGLLVARRPLRARVLNDGAAPAPVGVAIVAFLAGGAWFALLIPSVTRRAITHVPPAIAIAFASAVAVMTAIVVRRWSRTKGWGDRHRLALIAGALVANMGIGFLTNRLTGIDLPGKIVLNVATLLGLALVAMRLRSRAALGEPTRPLQEDGRIA